MTPTPGKTYDCNGYLFRVDLIRDGQVYVARIRADGIDLMRVTLEVWRRELATATEERI